MLRRVRPRIKDAEYIASLAESDVVTEDGVSRFRLTINPARLGFYNYGTRSFTGFSRDSEDGAFNELVRYLLQAEKEVEEQANLAERKYYDEQARRMNEARQRVEAKKEADKLKNRIKRWWEAKR